MGNHSKVAQVLQAGVEVTEGTPATVTKRFPGLLIEFSPDGNYNKYRASGSKWTTIVIQGKEWTKGPISGPVSFGELPYLLASIVNYAAPVTASGITTWTHAPAISTPDVSKAYTFQWGDTTSAWQVAGAFVNELTLKFTRESAEYTGSFIGARTEINALTVGGVTQVENVPVAASKIDVYYSLTSQADLEAGGVQLVDEAFEAEFKLSKRFATIWPLNSSFASFHGRVEDAPDATFSLKLKADTTGSDFIPPVTLARAREGTTIWFRIKCTGPVLAAGTYLLKLDVNTKVAKPYQFVDIDGALCGLAWDFELVDDGVSLSPFKFVVQNATAAL